MANSVDPDQNAPVGAVWSGPARFAYVILSETLVYEIFIVTRALIYKEVITMLDRTPAPLHPPPPPPKKKKKKKKNRSL